MASTHGDAQSALSTAEKQAAVVEHVRQGLSFREIADLMGLSKSQVHRLFHAGLDRIPAENVQAYREQQLTDLALARQVVLDVLGATHVVVSNGRIIKPITGVDEDDNYQYGDPLLDDGPAMAAIDRLVKLQEREAAILGSDAEKKVSADLTVNYTVGGGIDPAALT